MSIKDQIVRASQLMTIDLIIETLDKPRGWIYAFNTTCLVIIRHAHRNQMAMLFNPIETAVIAYVESAVRTNRSAIWPTLKPGDY